jgi:hypothetical protein
MDAVLALVILGVLLMMLTATTAQQAKGERKLAATRAAVRAAEAALLTLQAGGAPAGVRVDRLPDAAPAGFAWVRVSRPDAPATSLVGLVPADRAVGAAAPGGQAL